MARMTRKQALEWIRIYAAEGNDDLAVRVYAENRISRKAFDEAFALGKAQADRLRHT